MFPCLPLCRVTRNFPMATTNQIPKKLAIEPMPKARQISSEDSFQWQAKAVVWLYSKHQRSLFTVKPGLNSFNIHFILVDLVAGQVSTSILMPKKINLQSQQAKKSLPQHRFPFWALFWPQLLFDFYVLVHALVSHPALTIATFWQETSKNPSAQSQQKEMQKWSSRLESDHLHLISWHLQCKSADLGYLGI